MESVEKLLEMLRSSDAGRRIVALQCLAGPRAPDVPGDWMETLFACEKDEDIGVRFWARKVRARLDAEKPSARPSGNGPSSGGTGTCADPIPIEQAFRQLKSSGSGFAAIELLHKLIGRQESEVKPLLLEYLKECKDPTQISYLTKHLGIAFPEDGLVQVLAPFLRHDDDRVVANTLEGLQAIGSPGAVALAAQLVGHPHHRVRLNAARILGAQDRTVVNKVLEQMLSMPDHPHFLMAACQAVRELKAVEFLPRLTELVDDPAAGESAMQAVASLGAHVACNSLAGIVPGFRESKRQNEILRAVAELLGPTSPGRTETKSTGPGVLATNPASAIGVVGAGNHAGFELIVGNRALAALVPKISRTQAEKTALEQKAGAFGFLSRMLYRPQPQDIVLGYAEERYQPFWHLICKATIDYSRSRELEFRCDPSVIQVRLFERTLSPNTHRVSMTGIEHCREESRREVYVDAENGGRIDLANHLKADRRVLKETEELMGGVSEGVIVVPARVKGSLVVRELLGELLKPVRAESIDAEKIEIEQLELIFRPVYAFEFTWGQKAAVLEIDGITGEVRNGRAVRERAGEIFNEETLFEIGAEALGLLLPGGTLAAKLARAVTRK